MFDKKQHWENVYENSSPLRVSWFQGEPALSLRLIHNAQIALDAPVLDVGGGASVLVDALCGIGYTKTAVLDISAKALAHAKTRLADKAGSVEWFEADVTHFCPPHPFALWHDRAVFHFLTARADRQAYVDVLNQALEPGGHLIMMAFAIDGPTKCSGLDIVQYDEDKIMAELGAGFELIESGRETHVTPAEKEQKFAYFRFKRTASCL